MDRQPAPDRATRDAGRPLPLQDRQRIGFRLALASVAASTILAIANIATGLRAGSTSVTATGFEFLGDVLASVVVLLAFGYAARPPDREHPYGHGRAETLAGLAVGMILIIGGVGICARSLSQVGALHPPPPASAAWPLIAAIGIRGAMASVKFRTGRRIGSSALTGDAWNDAVDVLSASAALAALGLTILDPARFLAADHYGGFVVGVVVVVTGLRVSREASLHLMDTMPEDGRVEVVRRIAALVPGVSGVEKCLARRSGLQYHVDLHIEVDPELTVRESHEIAARTRARLRDELEWVADVLVHVEPWPGHPPANDSRPGPV